MNAHMYAQIACHHLGEFADAAHHSAATVSLIPRTSPMDRRMVMFDPVVASLAESSRNHWITGYLARSQADASAAVNLGRELRHPDSLAFALVFDGWVHGHRRNWAACLASTEAGLAIASESGSIQTRAWNQCVHGWGLAHAGDTENGASELLAGIEASTAIMGQVALPQFYAMVAEVLLLRCDRDGAAEWIERAIALMNANNDLYFAAELHRLSARCRSADDGDGLAIEHLHDALRVARSQGATLFELRAALDLAALDPGSGMTAVSAGLAHFPEPEPWYEILAARRLSAEAVD
jgi:hypothetical protein